MSPKAPNAEATQSASAQLEPGSLSLRQAADALGSSTTTLRKMIRQGRLPEAEKVKTQEGRVWAIPADSIPGIAKRAGFSVSVVDAIDLREPDNNLVEDSIEEVLVDPSELDNTIRLDDRRPDSWRHDPVPSEITEVDTETESVPAPLGRVDTVIADNQSVVADKESAAAEASTALESIGEQVEAETDVAEVSAPTLADVLDTALLEKLLGAKEAETVALVKAERQRTEYEALAARQLEMERRYADADLERSQLADRLHNEALARAISDARVTELRDQLQREITYAEAERYERRQALARETQAAAQVAETRAALGWRGRRRLRRSEQPQ